MSYLKQFLLLCLSFLFLPSVIYGAHGISIDGKLKYPTDFKHFDYVSPDAVQGGKITLHDLGSFDKMNPFTLKGTVPFGIDSLVFEPLAVASLDEPFSEYGLIAKDIELAQDKLSVTFTIDENARFSDDSPVRVEDVKFSLETLKSDKVHPFYPSYYKDIKDAVILDNRRIRFNFTQVNRELHMIAAQIPVMSEKFYSEHGFASTQTEQGLTPPIGSGPYVVSSINQGKSITYTKNSNYWANNHPSRKGFYNFETITVKYYKDQIVSVEAFKAGEFDFMLVNIAKQWTRDMQGGRFADASIIKKVFPHKNNAGMQGFLLNTRKKIFQDPKVREALGLAFDFEWTNKALFYKQYSRSNSFFSNSMLAATGLPEGLELSYLLPFKEQLPEKIFTNPLKPPSTDQKGGLRLNLRRAKNLLKEAGWTVTEGRLRNSAGKEFFFEMLLVSPSFERVMAPFVKNLAKLGIVADYRTIDPALYTDRLQNFDFDMVVHVYGQSQAPGNEQRNFWHSQSADRKGSKNLAGIKDPVIDKLVEKIIYAETQAELTAACRALDRVLWYGYYLIPNWYMDGHRLAYHNIFQQPDTLPLYYNYFQLLMSWWLKD